jgi:5'-nucleotidase/UDP-sugar diphosphatase
MLHARTAPVVGARERALIFAGRGRARFDTPYHSRSMQPRQSNARPSADGARAAAAPTRALSPPEETMSRDSRAADGGVSLTALTLAGLLVIAVAGLFATVTLGATPAQGRDYRLTVLHVSDLQSRLEPVTDAGAACGAEDVQARRCYGGAARLAARIKKERAAGGNIVVVNAGNALTGPFYDQYKQQAISDTLNLIGFDAMTVGDREFVDGTQMLAQFQQTARFPLLGANVDVQRDPHMRDRIYPFLATVVGGEQVALLGYSSEQLLEQARPSGVVRVEPIETALHRWMEQLHMMGINKVIAISHAGRERDREIATRVDGIDVIVGAAPEQIGSKVARYLVVHKGPNGHPVLLAQPDAFGRSLGRLAVTFDASGVPTTWQGDALEITVADAEDQAVKAHVATLAAPLTARPVADRRAQPSPLR